MEPGGGRGHRTGSVGIDGLVAFAVGGGIGAVDVRRQGDVAELVESLPEAALAVEAEQAFAVLVAAEDGGAEAFAEGDGVAGAELASGAHEGEPGEGVLGFRADQEGLDVTGEAVAMAVEAGGDDAGIVQDEAVAGAEVGGEVGEGAVFPAALGAVEDEHARGGAVGERRLSDGFGRQVEVELGEQQGVYWLQ